MIVVGLIYTTSKILSFVSSGLARFMDVYAFG